MAHTTIMYNEEIVQKTLKELKELEVKIFIDDFGTGYSSFNYLKKFFNENNNWRNYDDFYKAN